MKKSQNKNTAKLLRTIKNAVMKHDTFALFSHEVPDGDAIGSQVALALALRALGKKVTSLRFDGVPEALAFLNRDKAIQNYRPHRDRKRILDAEVIFILDASDYARLGEFTDCIGETGSLVINIDHHCDNSFFGDINFVRFGAGGTAELVFEVVRELGVLVRGAIAEAIYVGICTDTLGFKYIDPAGNIIGIVSQLVRAGIDIEDLQEKLYYLKPDSYLHDLAAMLKRVSYQNGGSVAWFAIPGSEELSYYQRELAMETLHRLLCMKKTKASLMLHQLKYGVEVWFRSKTDVNVGTVADEFGGGGHKTASGALLNNASLAEAIPRVIARVAAALPRRTGCRKS